jgi:hypothetical protein
MTTWIIIIIGVLIHLPLIYAQLLMIRAPDSQKTKDLIVGPGEDWRDNSNMEFSLGFAWGDVAIYFPILVIGTVGILLEMEWGYVFYFAAGLMAIYFSIVFWVAEKKYAISKSGRIMYYTFYWGFFVYWGFAAIIYSLHRLNEVIE